MSKRNLPELISPDSVMLPIEHFNTPLQQILLRGIETSPESITIADMRHPGEPLIYVNEAFTTMTGYEPHEVIGHNCRFLQGKDTLHEDVQKIRDAIKKKQSVVVELKNYRKDGTAFVNRLSLVPIMAEAGVLTHYLGIQSDITEEKERFRQRQRTHAMKHTMEAVNDVMGNLLNHFTLIRHQLDEMPDADPEMLKDIDNSLKDATIKLRKMNAMTTYAEKKFGTSEIFMIDYDEMEEND